MPKPTKFYHRCLKSNLTSILTLGLLPGSEVDEGEKLTFVMATRSKQEPTTGGTAYIEFEIEDERPPVWSVNDDWCEIHRPIKVEEFTAIAIPPSSNEEALALFEHCNKDANHPDWKGAWEYKELHR